MPLHEFICDRERRDVPSARWVLSALQMFNKVLDILSPPHNKACGKDLVIKAPSNKPVAVTLIIQAFARLKPLSVSFLFMERR